MLPIYDINVKQRKKQKITAESRQRMLSLDEYWSTAIHCIAKFCKPRYLKYMLANDDAISFVVDRIMWGTVRYTPDRGAKLESYHIACARWAIDAWIKLYNGKADLRKKEISLDKKISNDSRGATIAQILPGKTLGQDEVSQKILTEIFNGDILTSHQKQCLEMYFVDKLKYREIGAALGITRQAAQQTTKAAVKKLKRYLEL